MANTCGSKNNKVNKTAKLHSIHMEFTLQICHTYQLLHFNSHFQMTSKDSIIKLATNNNIFNKMTKFHSIQSKFTLQYIALTDYYMEKNTNLDNQ